MSRACKRNGIRVYAAGTRSSNKVKKAALVTKSRQTGRVHILLVGQLRGRSRIYLKELNHLMRLAPKPFSINGVALKRENGRYCINARTKVAPPHMVGEYFSTHCDEVTSVLTRSSKNSAESVIHWIQHIDIQTMDVEGGEQLRYELQGTKGPPLFFECGKNMAYHESRVDRPWKDIVAEFLSPGTFVWILLLLLIFAVHFMITLMFFPYELPVYDNIASSQVGRLFLEGVVKFGAGIIAHQCTCVVWLHKLEHKYAFQNPVKSTFVIACVYVTYYQICAWALCFLTMVPSLMTGTTWAGSTIPMATLVFEVFEMCIRILMWVMEQRPSIYKRCPRIVLNFMRFFRTHFTFPEFEFWEGKWGGWSSAMGYGAGTPFWDVIYGSCPFDIKWSVPIPFVDFYANKDEVFFYYVDPRAIKWSPLQRVWYGSWLALVISTVAYTLCIYWAPFGSAYPQDWQ